MQKSSQFHAATALSPEKKPGICWIDGWLGGHIRSGGFGENIFFPLPRFETVDRPANRLVTKF